MTLTPYQLALIAGGFGIAGALLGAWINHRLARHRDKETRNRARFDAASSKFRSIIAQRIE